MFPNTSARGVNTNKCRLSDSSEAWQRDKLASQVGKDNIELKLVGAIMRIEAHWEVPIEINAADQATDFLY